MEVGLQQVPLSRKIFYGMGGVSMNLCDLVFLQWLFMRYAPTDGPALVSPRLIGAYILLGRVFEAIILPIIGHWSDGCKSRGGRRLPFIVRGLLPWSVAIFLMWMPPFAAGSPLNSIYLPAIIIAYLFFYNLVVNPYLGLLPELTSDLRERVDLATIQAAFIMLSAIIFTLMGVVLQKGGWIFMSGGVTMLTILFMLPLLLTIRERPRPERETEQRIPLIEGLRLTIKNKAFLAIVISASFYWFGLDVIMKLLPLWTTSYLGEGKDAVTTLLIPFLVMNIIFFFVINVLSKRFGKYALLLATFIASGLSFLLMPCVGYAHFLSPFAQTGIVMTFIGMSVAGFMLLPFAILSDVVDYDEQITGRRREAIFFGFQGTFQKLTLGVSSFTFGQLAYKGADNVVSVGGLRFVAALAGLMCLIGFFIFLTYPLRERDGKLVVLEPPGK